MIRGKGVYLDASALAKLYLPERESDELEGALIGRRDLLVSDLSVTEVISAAARYCREGKLSQEQLAVMHTALLDDLLDESYVHLTLGPAIHREAERFLIGYQGPLLRAADTLHLAIALDSAARTMVTYDRRLGRISQAMGLHLFSPGLPVLAYDRISGL